MARRTPPDRRESILAAARAEFAARGYAGTRLEDVAARVGISKAALYLQFSDKQALFLAMIDWLLAANLPNAVPAALASASPSEQLPALIAFAASQVAEGEIAFLPRLIIGESGNFPELAKLYHDRAISRILGLIESIIARGVASGEFRAVDPAMAARSVAGGVLIGALWRTVLEPAGAPPLDVRALAASHADILLHGLIAGDAS
ncbi:TetR/AcrR family transcriptional regulator [Sphingomonas sp. LB-2]|uniref:TetR/AcrR family transcriptional regulator n=1 Tax=Sphingomonas caeni TaxID=2984949 RepID=UPI002230E246|nr:TetR/AcrR family transcriptional regulator [Sphingomonas caeni]MCW3847860.1 TetR/AcrR family transcriptional regulator [Sphingomonas caeni]